MGLFWKRKKAEYISLGLNRAATPEKKPREPASRRARTGLSGQFKTAVASTRESLAERIDSVVAGKREIDSDVLDELEEALIGADIGVQTSLEIIDKARQQFVASSLTT